MRRVRKPAASTINATIRIRLGRFRLARRRRRRFAIETPREPSYAASTPSAAARRILRSPSSRCATESYLTTMPNRTGHTDSRRHAFKMKRGARLPNLGIPARRVLLARGWSDAQAQPCGLITVYIVALPRCTRSRADFLSFLACLAADRKSSTVLTFEWLTSSTTSPC
jgi:hypothetical protein